MSSSHQPAAGADSPEALAPYDVLMVDRFDPDFRLTVRIAAAYGPRDARNQAEYEKPECAVVKVVEARS